MVQRSTITHEIGSKVKDNIQKVIVGKEEQIDFLFLSLLVGGHVLLEDVPGTGKTKLARAFSRSMDLSFSRIQFTIDLLPSDLTGIHYFDKKTDSFIFRKGPLFTNVLLADEINRATARTQSSLLECMEEKQITVDGETNILEAPFFVIATQNPLETQGTFPLPEAQLDRFIMMLSMTYPTVDEGISILKRYEKDDPLQTLESVVNRTDLTACQNECDAVYVSDDCLKYLLSVVEATRNHNDVKIGASPRASIALLKLCKARAALEGRSFITPDDIKALAAPTLAHRLSLHSVGSLAKNQSGVSVTDRRIAIVSECLKKVVCPTEEFAIPEKR